MTRQIIIVDDHKLFAHSLKILVDSFEGFEVSKMFKNGHELTVYLKSAEIFPEIILLDMRMPKMNGLETMEYLMKNHPEQKVLALTVEQDEEQIIRMLRMGCRGYLLKDINPEVFEKALNTVTKTGYFQNKTVTAAISHHDKKEELTFTDRELEFLALACSEKTYKEVAENMNLSPKTVDNYRESLFSKLHVKSRVGLVMYAIKEGIYKV